ncbi:MASE4 domain-containing protein [Rhizobium sullae]|uniref:histidine kinase n=1 Tax=Rhizobium sullae TaxID=50338 RepID=A0A2N0DGP9_RHISU|nr:MASE4 domain-containing protein [Rhizobium sullae]PKA45294.1 two-component sensor histidine kinase [Rhizobium sullae]TCU20218.1 phospho-acceptor domain-containing protein [Rhizobium sullae]UWU17825.1 MASE4 domain-containing protein [Rhizobium sullae]
MSTPEEEFFVLSELSPGSAQKWLALAVVFGLLVLVFIAAGALARVQPHRIEAFVPAYTTAMFVNDSITAILLFAQFSILRSRAILVIASGYVFTALILIPWILAFPGVFVPGRGLIGGLQSTSWLYFSWHAGFSMFVIGYALLKDADTEKRFWRGTVGAAIALGVALTAVVVLAAAYVCVALEALLPRVVLDPLRLSPLWPYVGAPVALVSIVALLLLWIRRRSMLDLWLMVVMFLYAIEIPLSYYPTPVRFSIDWYAVRIIGFFSSSLVLIVMLYEITTLYARLLGAVRARRQEREARLVTGEAVAATVAHEVKQPLSGMITSADAGLRFLNRSSPDLEEAKQAFKQIVAGGHRAAAVIEGIRTIFKKEDRKRASFNLNDLTRETLALMRGDLAKHRILLETVIDEQLTEVMGDRTQLQQVLVILITNAIDSMIAVGGSRVLSVESKMYDYGHVGVSVADTGTGISPQDTDRIFNPLFTTKPEGMGMGLSICRSIIEAHDGRLWAAPNTPQGAIFHFTSICSVSAREDPL